MKKIRKNYWEKIIRYPSFNIRFIITLLFIIIPFIALWYFTVFESSFSEDIANQIALTNLIIQSVTLVIGIFAAYYALRQLVETRFVNLDEAGMQELKSKHYSRAAEKWREAFYIRPEASVFTNMCESLLLTSDYNTFDQYIRMSQGTNFLSKEIFSEISDQILLLYLKSIRHLLVKNQGEAEKYISDLMLIVKGGDVPNLNWNFLDLRTSTAYQDLTGECKNIAENLIAYISKTILPNRKIDFEKGNFASTIEN